MYTLYSDETNVDPSHGTFFIYGGIVIAADQISAVHQLVVDVRAEYGFQPSDQFKFQTSSRPKHLDIATWTSAKATLLDRLTALDVDLIVYVIHHGIAASSGPAKTLEWAVNSVVARFDLGYLAEKNSYGAVCVDRLDPKTGYAILKKRFQEPIELPNGRQVSLDRVIHYSMSCDGASHISSVVDVALGAARYCINAATGKGDDTVATRLFPLVARLMWGQKVGTTTQLGGYGYLQYPKQIKVAAYRADYDTLRAALQRYVSQAEAA